MGEESLKLDVVDPRSPEAAELVGALSVELARRYDYMEDGSGGFRPEDAMGPKGAFVVGRIGGSPVACGAIRPLKGDVAELKRVFVKVDFRGRGYSKHVVRELEHQPECVATRQCVWRPASVSRRRSRSIRVWDTIGFRTTGSTAIAT